MKIWFLIASILAFCSVPVAHTWAQAQTQTLDLVSGINPVAERIQQAQQDVEDAAYRMGLQRASGGSTTSELRHLRSKARELDDQLDTLSDMVQDIERSLKRKGRHDLLERHHERTSDLMQRMDRARRALETDALENLSETCLPKGRINKRREREKRLYSPEDDSPAKKALAPGALLGPGVEPLRRAPREAFDPDVAALFPSNKAFGLVQEKGVFRLVSFEREATFENTAPAANNINKAVRFDLDLPLGVRPCLVTGLGPLQGLISQAAIQAMSLPAPQDSEPDGRSIVLTPEIVALAEELGKNPVRIYEYVNNTVMYQPYWGALKGSAETLAQKSGNDADQASLLIALLRASGYPARYGRALVSVDIERAKQWLGVEDDTCVDWMLATAEVPGTTALVDKAGNIRAVRFEHIFVEAYLPYADYRGTLEGTSHKLWVPLAPAFKKRLDVAGIDITELVDFDAEALADYLEANAQKNPDGSYTGFDTDYLQEKIAEYTRAVRDYLEAEGLTLRDLTGYEEIIAQKMEILPITLPFSSENKTVFSILPDSMHYFLRLRLADGDGIELAEAQSRLLLDWQTPFVGLSAQRLTLSWEQTTEDDITQLPCYLVDLIPQVRLAGQVTAQGPECMMGSEAVLRVEIVSPNSGFALAHAYDYRITAGDYSAIVCGTDAFTGEQLMGSANRLQAAVDAQTTERDSLVGEYLYLTGMLYHYRLGSSQKQIARQYRVHHYQKPSALVCSASLDMNRAAGDFPLSIRGYRLIFDFGNNYSMVIPKTDDLESRLDSVLAIGPEMSALEHVVLQEMFLSPAVSAVKLLELANEQGVPIYDITPENRNAMMAELDLSAEDLALIERELDRNQRVTVTKTRLSAGTYIGAPIISLPFDETDLYAPIRTGYFISGPANGGELYDMVKDWLTKKGVGDWFDYAVNKKNVIQDIVTNSDEAAKYGNYIFSYIYDACTTVWKKRFGWGCFVTVTSLSKSVFWRYIGLGSLIICIDFEDNKYFDPNSNEMRTAKYIVRSMYGGVPLVSDDLIPEVSALNGKNFKGYADPVQGIEGDFYFSDNETKTGDTLKVQLLLKYRSPICLNEYNTTTTVGTFKAGPVDLDIDSNNDNGFDEPECSDKEDDIEDEDGLPDTPGKIMGVNDWDVDGDDIPNFADGFSTDVFDNTGEDAGGQFVPVMIEFVPELNLEKTYVTFSYSESDPNGVQREDGRKENTYIYTAAQGHMRLWTKNGEESRNATDGNQGGDFLRAGSKYKVSDLGPGPNITLYVEAVNPSAELADQSIKVSCKAYDEEDEPFASGEDTVKVTIVKINMGVDGNRDTEIKFDDPEDRKYEFWVNNDHDVNDDGEEDDADDNIQDSSDDKITTLRDLEDFARLHIEVPDLLLDLPELSYSLKFENIPGSQATPAINIFPAVSDTGSLDYLSNMDDAILQRQKERLLQVSAEESPLPDGTITPGEPYYFIFEGVEIGEGNLTFIMKLNGEDVCKQTVRLALRDIEAFYRRWVVTADEDDVVDIDASIAFADEGKYEYKPETNDFVLFVHGWNLEDWEKRRWAETMFKRLWWQGYKGHMAFLDWPTLTYPDWYPVPPPLHYDISDYRAYQTSWYLKNILKWLDNSDHAGRVRVLAHSMGNQVMGEALRLLEARDKKWIKTYIASQAAVSAHAYDESLENDAPFTLPPFAPTTPEVMRYYPIGAPSDSPSGVPYYNGNHSGVGKMFRYFNDEDYALSKWEINNYTKPDNSYYFENNDGSETFYTEGSDRFYQRYISGSDTDGYPIYSDRVLHMTAPLERYEIFSFCAESRSRALGAVLSPVVYFEQFNLQTSALDYDSERYSHSRQFRSNIAREWKYWQQFYEDCGL